MTYEPQEKHKVTVKSLVRPTLPLGSFGRRRQWCHGRGSRYPIHHISTSWSSRGPPLFAVIIGNGAVINDVVLCMGPRSTWALLAVVALARCSSSLLSPHVPSALRRQWYFLHDVVHHDSLMKHLWFVWKLILMSNKIDL